MAVLTPRGVYDAASGWLSGQPDYVLSVLLLGIAAVTIGIALLGGPVLKLAAVLYLGLP